MNSTHKHSPMNRGIALILLLILLFGTFGGIATAANAASTDFPCYGTVVGANKYGGLKFRASASTSSAIKAYLPDGTVVKLLSQSKGWYKAEFNGEVGYLSSSYIELNLDTEGVVVNANGAGGLMARTGPGTNHAGLYRIKDGTKVHILSTAKDQRGNLWYKAQHGKDTVYLSASYIQISGKQDSSQEDNNVSSYTEEPFAATGTVTAKSGLNVRKDPSTKNASLGKLPYNTSVVIKARTSNGWYLIAEGSYKGCYISSNYIKLEDSVSNGPAEKFGTTTAPSLNMRKGPSTTYAIIKALPYGTKVQILARCGQDWYEVQAGSSTGYVHKDYVSLNGISYKDLPEKYNSAYPVWKENSFWAIIKDSIELFDEDGDVIMNLPKYTLLEVKGQYAFDANKYVVVYFGTTGIIQTTKVTKVNNALHCDVPNQKVTLIRNGQLVVQTDCVTGLKGKMDTPVGKYSILNYDKNAVLRGKNLDGSPYEQPVDFWMRFYGGYGFHDASYRYKFGGRIYETNGSHGCVNLPPKYAEQIFAQVYVGLPVYISGH